MCGNPAILPEFSNCWEPPGLWTPVPLLSAFTYIPHVKYWAFICEGIVLPSRTGQATGRCLETLGGQPALVMHHPCPSSAWCLLPLGSLSYPVYTASPLGPFFCSPLSGFSSIRFCPPCISLPRPQPQPRALSLARGFLHLIDEEIKP